MCSFLSSAESTRSAALGNRSLSYRHHCPYWHNTIVHIGTVLLSILAQCYDNTLQNCSYTPFHITQYHNQIITVKSVIWRAKSKKSFLEEKNVLLISKLCHSRGKLLYIHPLVGHRRSVFDVAINFCRFSLLTFFFLIFWLCFTIFSVNANCDGNSESVWLVERLPIGQI